jgi:hypothetical protein
MHPTSTKHLSLNAIRYEKTSIVFQTAEKGMTVDEHAIELAVNHLLETIRPMVYKWKKLNNPSDQDIIAEWEVWTFFLDPINDSISFYIEQRKDGTWRITDGGEAWGENSLYGILPEGNIEKIAKSIIGSHFDVKMDGGELYISFKKFDSFSHQFQTAVIDIISAQLRVYTIGELVKQALRIEWTSEPPYVRKE